jgi:hypothetical protein
MYCTQKDLEFWGMGEVVDGGVYGNTSTYTDRINRAISHAQALIDEYCRYPRGVFESGGVQVSSEYHDGNEIAYHYNRGKLYDWQWDYDNFMLLSFKYQPVLSTVSYEEETTAGTWTTRTSGSSNDYVTVDEGIHILDNFPDPGVKNLRVTYLAGYTLTPQTVQEVSARMAVATLQKIYDSTKRRPTTAGGVGSVSPPNSSLGSAILTEEIKTLLRPYVNNPISGGFCQ